MARHPLFSLPFYLWPPFICPSLRSLADEETAAHRIVVTYSLLSLMIMDKEQFFFFF
jgi:hypothetical protein